MPADNSPVFNDMTLSGRVLRGELRRLRSATNYGTPALERYGGPRFQHMLKLAIEHLETTLALLGEVAYEDN